MKNMKDYEEGGQLDNRDKKVTDEATDKKGFEDELDNETMKVEQEIETSELESSKGK